MKTIALFFLICFSQGCLLFSQTNSLPRKIPKIEGFTYLGTQKYDCGGQVKIVYEYRYELIDLDFVLIPQGKLIIKKYSKSNEKMQEYTVSIASFLMSKTEVTQSMWTKIMGTKPWTNDNLTPKGDYYPVVMVSHYNIKQFCKITNLKLPTESQWEYACRANTSSRYFWGNNTKIYDFGWFRENTIDAGKFSFHEVGKKLPNAFGLYDMSGNVWELCEDNWHENIEQVSVDGSAWISPNKTWVCKGGSFLQPILACTPNFRSWTDNAGDRYLGFRVIKEMKHK